MNAHAHDPWSANALPADRFLTLRAELVRRLEGLALEIARSEADALSAVRFAEAYPSAPYLAPMTTWMRSTSSRTARGSVRRASR